MLKRILPYLNPAYHIRQMKEDLRLMRQALRTQRVFSKPHTPDELQQLFRGRLFTCFFLSGPTSFLGAGIGGVLQWMTNNAWVGLFGTILGTLLVTTIAYQVFWFFGNRRVYRVGGHFGWRGFHDLQRDLWPVHLFGAKTGLSFALVAIPINAVIIGIFEFFGLASRLPVPLLVLIIDAIVVQGTFVRIMGDFFDRYAHELSLKHFDYLASVEAGE